MQKEELIEEMNKRGSKKEAFAFLIDFDFRNAKIFSLHNSSDHILWDIPIHTNASIQESGTDEFNWNFDPISFSDYKKGFEFVKKNIHEGNTYLLNLTYPSKVETNLSLDEIFLKSKARYKVLLKDEFVCFSPEIFVRIDNGVISSYPMKGTIDANITNAEEILEQDKKELAEHNTIVDLIRNDLSLIAENVTVEKFRYQEKIKTNQGDLIQVSSKITGDLPDNYHQQIGTLISRMLPAGSICGAPKKKTVEIIKEAEQYVRGYYTGIFGVFDGQNLDSCVLIRYLEKDEENFIFKSGGGITFLSDCESEYQELIRKVYVPIT